MRKIVITFCLLLFASEYLSSEIIFGGEGTFSVPLLINLQNIPDTKPSFDLLFLPRMTVDNNIFELSCEGILDRSSDEDSVSLDIQELYLTVNITDEVLFKVGKFAYLPGIAEFFSNNNFFVPVDFEKLLTGNLKTASTASELIQTKLFWDSIYLIVTVEPVPQFSQIPEFDSPWFPMKDLPESFPNLLSPSEPDLLLENVTTTDFTDDSTLSDSSFGLEAGITTSFADFTLLYFHGIDKYPLYQAEMSFPEGWFQNYEINLYRVKKNVDILGCTSTITFDSFRFWEDAAFYFSKAFLTNKLSENSLQTAITSAPSLSATTGASWEYYGSILNVLLLSEYEYIFIFSNDTSIQVPSFSDIFSLLTKISIPSKKASCSFLSFFSMLDKSFLVNISADLSLSDELEFSLVVPVFLGGIKTNFGQFKDNHLVTASVSWRF